MRAPAVSFLAALVLVVAGFSTAHAGSIILNSDFSDGKTHWHGDGDSPEVGGKLVVTLKPDRWTVVRQTFSAKASALKIQIKYSLSDDCTIGRTGDKLLPPLTRMGLEEACALDNGIYDVSISKWEDWKILLVSGGSLIDTESVVASHNNDRSTNVQARGAEKTFTTTLSSWNNSFDTVDLCLCFPPGSGSITLDSVVLTPPGQ